jgi:hypothetical protein
MSSSLFSRHADEKPGPFFLLPVVVLCASGHPQSLASPPNHQNCYDLRMAPTVFRQGAFRFFFFSREEPRKHIHVSHTDGEAKFWLEPKIELAMNQGLSQNKSVRRYP